ncbi:MAG: AMP-binding protein [Chloroflexia bacterium]
MMASPVTGTPPGSVGKPNPGVEVRLLDDAGNEVAEGTTAEMVVRSPSMMLGYLDDPEATAAILRDGWLYTGDLAHRDAAGFYYIEGRRGLQINVGGSKVAPEEVEAVLLQHPGVREAVAVPQPDRSRGEVVRAIVVPEGDAPDAQALRRFCRARLAGYKVPRSIEFRSEPLPRSALGKVIRQRL